MFECRAAKEIWAQSEFVKHLKNNPPLSFANRWVWFTKTLDTTNLCKFAALMWAAWFCRNKIFFEQANPDAVTVVGGFVRLVEEYRSYYANMISKVAPTAGAGSVLSSWQCPPPGVVKVNTEAHVVDGVLASLVVALRGADGILIAIPTKRIGATSPSIAKAQAVRYGIALARRCGYVKIEIESDALETINAVKSKAKGSSPIFLVFDDIRHDRSLFELRGFSHVKRACNTVAYMVARLDTSK